MQVAPEEIESALRLADGILLVLIPAERRVEFHAEVRVVLHMLQLAAVDSIGVGKGGS